MVLSSVGASASSCREPTEIVVVMTTDVPCARVSGSAVAVGALSDLATRLYNL